MELIFIYYLHSFLIKISTKGLIDYYKNINHILDYGEFRHPEYDSMLRRGIKDIVIRSYDKYTQISIDKNVKVLITSNVFSALLSKIADVKELQELTTAFLLGKENNDSVAIIQDVSVAILAGSSVKENKEIIANYIEVARNQGICVAILAQSAVDQKKEAPHKGNESAVNVTFTNKEIDFQKKRMIF